MSTNYAKIIIVSFHLNGVISEKRMMPNLLIFYHLQSLYEFYYEHYYIKNRANKNNEINLRVVNVIWETMHFDTLSLKINEYDKSIRHTLYYLNRIED